MADNSILTPGYQDTTSTPEEITPNIQYLEKDNYLSEYQSESDKSIVRQNLNVPSADSVYTKQEVNTELSQKITTVIQEYLKMEDPHGILPQVEEMIENMVKTDGSTPFVQPQGGIDPINDNHLTTKKFVTRLLKEHMNAEDPHEILPEVSNMLESYVKSNEVYSRSLLYTKDEINKQASEYLRKDGTTPFTKAQVGADPQIDSHLTTKRYVDKAIYEHVVDVDPHGFFTILNQRLAPYAKKANVLDKSETYSRIQIDNLISAMVEKAVELAIGDYLQGINDKFDSIKQQKYVKQDGSIPFKQPQSGVDATEENHLTTLRQVKQSIEEVSNSLEDKIDNKDCVWITSGPVESTVGHLEDKTPVPPTMTLQEIMDAIFYGQGICLEVPDYVIISESCDITACIHGSLGMVEYAEIYQNGELIYTLYKEDFEDGCVTIKSLPLLEDTEFTFKVYYTNGSMHEVSKTVKCYMPVFVGLLPKWKFGSNVTMDYLIQLCREDIEGTQNRFLNQGKELTSFTFKYKFQDPKLRHPFIVSPSSYPSLTSMTTNSQRFGIDAFDVIDMIPMRVPGVDRDIIFKIYIYRQALSSLNQEVTFNFISKE